MDGDRVVDYGQHAAGDYRLKDSGTRQEFDTGSRRDTREGKGRYDLLPPLPLQRMALLYEAGAKKYGERNWEKGQPLSRYLDSAMRHLVSWMSGDRDEEHLIQCAWNCWSYIQTEAWIEQGRLPDYLNDVDFFHGRSTIVSVPLEDHGVRGPDGLFHQMGYAESDIDEHDHGLHAPRPGSPHPDLL